MTRIEALTEGGRNESFKDAALGMALEHSSSQVEDGAA
jgi:hypothetical protein